VKQDYPEVPLVFASDIHDTAWLNIGGADIRLSPETPPASEQEQYHDEQLGDRKVREYRAGPTEVRLETVVTWVCPADLGDEACEVTRYDGTIAVKTARGSETISVRGECGC
jgi:hypothetical protein